ncbi:MAG TPA: hypothetical protein VF122_04490 [Caulobacteraceae bacterium]
MPPPDRMRWWALVAGVFVAAILAGTLLLLMRDPAPKAPPPPEGPRPIDINPPPLPIPPPPLTHADLVAASGRAAAAQERGEPAPVTDKELIGRRFLVRLPFGCGGVREDEVGAWAYDLQREALTVQVRPVNWTSAGWVRLLAGAAGVDAVEGFWLPPAISEDCAAGVLETPETVGLAMFFEPNSSRVLRRGDRPYEFTGKANPPSIEGYRLVLAGRIEGFDGAEPVRCRKDAPPSRSVCLAAVAFDQVAFEDGATGETLAEWRTN